MAKLAGPIPGENYTSDTRNYPWHRPPEFSDLDKAIDMISKRLLSEESAFGILTLVQMGLDVATITDIFVTSGIGAGKWTPDFAILLAGPVSHIIYLMAKGYGIDCNLGIDQPIKVPTKSYYEAVKLDQQKVKTVADALNNPEVQDQIMNNMSGFMGMSQPEEAAAPVRQGMM